MHINPLDIQPGVPLAQSISCKRGWADTLRVHDSTTGGTHNLLHNMLENLGCPTWFSCVEAGYQTDCEVEDPFSVPGQHSLRIFIYSSDGGPDEARFKKVIYTLTMEHLHVLFWPGICFMHACQLYVRSGLALVDSWAKSHYEHGKLKYFATLSKICQIWRENAVEIYRLFEEAFGSVVAVKYGSKIPARCIAGRWQSSHATEMRLYEVGAKRLSTVFNMLFERKNKQIRKRGALIPLEGGGQDAASGASASGAGAPPPETKLSATDELDPMTESVAQHRIRMSQWRTDVARALNDKLFWAVLKIHALTNENVEHFFRFLSAEYSPDDLETNGNQLSRLLGADNPSCGSARFGFPSKGAQFMDEYHDLLRRPGVFGLLDEPAFQTTSSHQVYGGMVQGLASLCVLLTLHHAANFQRRVIHTIDKFPHKLVLLSKSRPDLSCELRRGTWGGLDWDCRSIFSGLWSRRWRRWWLFGS